MLEAAKTSWETLRRQGMVDEGLRRAFASRGVGGSDNQHVNIIPSLYIIRRVSLRWWPPSSTSDIFLEPVRIACVARRRIINGSVARRTQSPTRNIIMVVLAKALERPEGTAALSYFSGRIG